MNKLIFYIIIIIFFMSTGCKSGPQDISNWSEQEIHAWMSSSTWSTQLPFKPDISINSRMFIDQNIKNKKDWLAAFDFLKKNDLSKIPLGRYDLTDNGAYVTISVYQTKDKDTSKYEAHRKFIDIQYVAEGEEYIELLPLDKINEEQIYDEENDITFFEDKKNGKMLHANKNHYFVFFPEDAHKPCLKINAVNDVRKIVVKIPMKD